MPKKDPISTNPAPAVYAALSTEGKRPERERAGCLGGACKLAWGQLSNHSHWKVVLRLGEQTLGAAQDRGARRLTPQLCRQLATHRLVPASVSSSVTGSCEA